MKLAAPLDFNLNEARNLVWQSLGTAPTSVEGRSYYDSVLHVVRYYNGTTWISMVDAVPVATYTANTIAAADTSGAPTARTIAIDSFVGRATGVNGGAIGSITAAQARTVLGSLDNFTPPASDLNLNSHKITGLATPASASDAANKGYVDATVQGLDVKASVRVASTANVSVSSAPSTIDGVTLASGDRVLLKDQTAPAENGIRVFTAAGASLDRAADAATSAMVTTGMFTFVAEGTANADKGWVLTTNDAITLGTTALAFTQFSGSGTVVGTTNRISVTGNQVDVDTAYAGQTSIVTLGTITTGVWNGTAIPVLYGGTGATTAAGAKTNLLFLTRYTTTIGDGSSSSFTVTHNLNSLAVTVEIYEVATGLTVYADVTRTTVNALTVGGFTTVPTSAQYAVVVIG